MKVGIIGAGALGSLIGCLLIEAGVDTLLYERDLEEREIIRTRGIFIEGVSGERTVWARIGSELTEKRDLILVLVKAYDTAGTIEIIEKIINKNGVILTLQNGIGNFELLNAAFPNQVLLGTTTMGAMSTGKGRIRHTGFGQTHIGEPNGISTPRVADIVDLLSRMNSGDVHVTDNAIGSVWSKLIINACINGPATLARLRNGDLPSSKAGRELIYRIVTECLEIVKKKRIKLLYSDPENRVIEVCTGTAENINSMFQDILASRRTEIDYINGALAREAKELGLSAPVNESVTLLMQILELNASVRI